MIAVMTSPRGSDYLAETLRAIDASASGRRLVIDDGGSLAEVRGWEVVAPRVRPRNPWPENRFASWEAIRRATEAREDLILLEDDVEPCGNAIAWAERLDVPADCAFVSLYAPRAADLHPGIWRSTVRHYFYAQALKIPLRTLDELTGISHAWLGSHQSHTDGTLRDIGLARRWTYGVHYPSLFQHVGHVSAICTAPLTKDRTSQAYPGRDFDALTLRIEDFL